MILGLREHEMRSNPCIIWGQTPFEPGIITTSIIIDISDMSCFHSLQVAATNKIDSTESSKSPASIA